MEHNRKNLWHSRRIILLAVGAFIVLVVSSVLILRFVPLKYEEEQYSSSIVLSPQNSDSAWFTVPDGYTIDGSYSTNSENPANVQITYRLPTTSETLEAYSGQSSQGLFKVVADAESIDNRYTFNFFNPASAGFFGIGAGPTITVTYSFKVYGTTTFLK